MPVECMGPTAMIMYFNPYLQDLLVTVFENGELTKEYLFDEIRDRAQLPLLRQKEQQQ